MKAKDINYKLYQYFINYDYKLFNSFIYGWESDFFAISKSGYSIEVEIKLSVGDFRADYKKYGCKGMSKHDVLTNADEKNKPNKFYFACPDGLIKIEDIDKKYGLIYVVDGCHRIVREAKFLHKEKPLEDKKYLKILLSKFHHRNIELRFAQKKFDYDIKYGQRRLFEYDYF